MLSPKSLIIFFIILTALFTIVLYEFNIFNTISSVQYISALFLIIAALVIYVYIKFGMNKKENSIMKRAKERAMEWWKENYNEELDMEDAIGKKKYYNRELFIGFKFKRKTSGSKYGQECIIILNGDKMDVEEWWDKATTTQLLDPFALFSKKEFGSVSRDVVGEPWIDKGQTTSPQNVQKIEFTGSSPRRTVSEEMKEGSQDYEEENDEK